MQDKKIQSFKKWSLVLLAYAIFVIVWGAWVRISQSGDGCGDHWPLCQGTLIPSSLISNATAEFSTKAKLIVEFTHRLTSGLFGIAVMVQFYFAKKYFDQNHLARKWAKRALVFMFIEALLGAALVKLALVTKNDSALRTVMISLHLLNSLALTGSLALTWDYSSTHDFTTNLLMKRWHLLNKILPVCFILIGVSGAIAALASTLFPSESLIEGLQKDFAPNVHHLIRLRILHPISGVLIGGLLALTASILMQTEADSESKSRAKKFIAAVIIGIVFGAITLVTHAPIWMKLVHLAIAHGIWIRLLLLLRSLQHKKML